MENAARDAGYFVTVAHTSALDRASVEAALDHLLAQAVEGIVVIAPQQRVQDAMAAVSLAVPSVTLHGAVAAGDDGVFVDQVEGARLATRHLIERGHRRIAHLCGPGDWSEARARRDGFLAEVAEHGGGGDERVVGLVTREGDWTAASGAEIAAGLLADDSVTAVFSSNDQMALGVLHAARLAGRRVPEDLAVVGFDDIPEAAFFAPPLTTVRQDFAELGRRCVARLVSLIEGGGAEGAGVAFGAPVAPVLVERASA